MTPADTPARFDSLGLADPIVTAVAALGYEEPTPIQREAIPVLISGRDLIGQAGTGTGKTAAFALPLIHRLTTASAVRTGGPRGLILVPTRELAMQVAEAVHKYAKRTPIRVVPVYGGAPMDQQIRALRRGVDVVVATPGRALDLMRRGTLTLDALDVLVLDEADEMLDMGFAEDLESILTATPATRQTALFAATMAHRIGRTGRIGREGVAITLVDPREQRLLRQIEALTRQPIEIAPLPTEAALQAKRLSALRTALEERITAGALDPQRAFVAGLAHDLDLMDVAAAAVSLLQKSGDSADAVSPPEEPAVDRSSGPMTALFVGAGRSAGIRPGDLVGAITNEAHLTSRQLGKITIAAHHSLVDVPEAVADHVIRALQRTTLRGKPADVRRHRSTRPGRKG